jgi:hypothetical protein
VELAELSVDGLATEEQVRLAARRNEALLQPTAWGTAPYYSAQVAAAAAAGAPWPAAWNVVSDVRMALGQRDRGEASRETWRQRALLVDIFGNPFRSSALDGSWLRWNDATVARIARGVYEERAFDRLPILADALLDAGCDDEELIQHCRGEGPHVRGCWAVDLMLGKQ